MGRMSRRKIADAATLARRLEERSVPEPNTGCVLWCGASNQHVGGYGVLGAGGRGRQVYAHRLAYELAHGPIPPGMLVCHKCDVPMCINPAHLFLGTHADNNADAHAKGRAAIGMNHGMARIGITEVQSIRIDRRPIKEIAADFGVSQALVSLIRHKKRWASVPDLVGG
jgi:hypothetical protein